MRGTADVRDISETQVIEFHSLRVLLTISRDTTTKNSSSLHNLCLRQITGRATVLCLNKIKSLLTLRLQVRCLCQDCGLTRGIHRLFFIRLSCAGLKAPDDNSCTYVSTVALSSEFAACFFCFTIMVQAICRARLLDSLRSAPPSCY